MYANFNNVNTRDYQVITVLVRFVLGCYFETVIILKPNTSILDAIESKVFAIIQSLFRLSFAFFILR